MLVNKASPRNSRRSKFIIWPVEFFKFAELWVKASSKRSLLNTFMFNLRWIFWAKFSDNEKFEIVKKYINLKNNDYRLVKYFDKYVNYLSKNSLNSFLGKHDGVSVIMNGRELAIEKSFVTKDTRERFIGVEISFDEDCDDIMGVDGKKQSAQNFFKREIWHTKRLNLK